MGIGLSVSSSIIEPHRGRLWAKANGGPGATFSFSIPPDLRVLGARESQPSSFGSPDGARVLGVHQRVKELLGPDQAQVSAVDWLNDRLNAGTA